MAPFQTAVAVRTPTRTLHQQSLIPHCSDKEVTMLPNNNLIVCASEIAMSLHEGELSWMEKIQSCSDVVHHAIEDLSQCQENLFPHLTQTTELTRDQQHVPTTMVPSTRDLSLWRSSLKGRSVASAKAKVSLRTRTVDGGSLHPNEGQGATPMKSEPKLHASLNNA